MFWTPLERFADTDELSPPHVLSPHVITDPSAFSAAKALALMQSLSLLMLVNDLPAEQIEMTPLARDAATDELSPPNVLSPHVITEPSTFRAANARSF